MSRNRKLVSTLITAVVMTFMMMGEVSAQSTHDEWWALVEECVSEKSDAAGDRVTAAWEWTEWENECGEAIPYPESTTVDFIPEFEVKAFAQRNVMDAVTYSRMAITSLNDNVTVTGVTVNRGNCDFLLSIRVNGPELPRTLVYAQTATGYITCNVGTVREVTVSTNVGDVTYRIN